MPRGRNTAWRIPTDEQREILRVVLLADFPNRAVIAEFLDDIRVQLNCSCGCGSFDFRLPVRVALHDQEWPVGLWGVSTTGINALIYLFRKEGRDFTLEIAPLHDGPFGRLDPTTVSDFDRDDDSTGTVPSTTLTVREHSLIEEHAPQQE